MSADAAADTKPAAPVEEPILTDVVLTKYKTAADITKRTTDKLIALAVEGAKVIDLCVEGDKLIEAETSKVYNNKKPIPPKGLAFPTCVSVNNVISHFSPLPTDTASASVTLAKGDVVKFQLGAQIDGYASIAAETIVVGASKEDPVTGPKADVIKAAYTAAEAALRTIKIGEKNFAVTEIIADAVKPFEAAPVEGQLSCAQSQNVIDGKKRIIINPAGGGRGDVDVANFEEGDVFGVDVLVSTNKENHPKTGEAQTTVYKKTNTTYLLKLAASRKVFSEIQKKAGAFPFTLRTLEDQSRARMGVQECVQHGLLTPYDVTYDKSGEFVAQFFFTIALTKAGPLRLTHPPSWYSPELVKSEKEPSELIKELNAKPLRPSKKAKKAAKAAEAA